MEVTTFVMMMSDIGYLFDYKNGLKLGFHKKDKEIYKYWLKADLIKNTIELGKNNTDKDLIEMYFEDFKVKGGK